MAKITQKHIDMAHKIIARMPKAQFESVPSEEEEKQAEWVGKLIEAMWDNLRAHRAGLGWDDYEKTIIKSPVMICLPRKTKEDKKCALNLNAFRNWKHFTANDVKVQYSQAMEDQLAGIKFTCPIELKFTYYKAQNRTSDRSNVISIVEKFFCDAMVQHGCIPDDNDNYIRASHAYSGGIDKENPRVEIEIIQDLDTPASAC
jgi:hypothetical protein